MESDIPRRVLMTADTVGGVWTYALELAAALREWEVEILLATMGAPLSADQRDEVLALRNVTVAESTYRLEWMEDPWADVRAAGEWLLALADRWSPEVIHLNGYVHANLPWPAPVLVVAHSCVLSWWRAVKGEPAPAEWRRYAEAVGAGLHAAHAIVAPTAAMAKAVRDYYGQDLECGVIPNGRTPSRFHIQSKEPFILAAGRLWDEAKNLRQLQQAAPALPWPVCIAGDQRHPNGLDFDPRDVRFLGRLSTQELAGWYSGASIYALPALYEPFGLSPVEAALSGCALVLGDIPSLREVWGDAALYVSPRDSAQLHSVLLSLIEDPARLASFAAAARARAQLYSPHEMGIRYRRQYETMCGARAEATVS